MNMKCGCRIPLSWPFLISVCEHGNPLQKDKSEVAKERKEEKKAILTNAKEALL
jgi:hypothetical protein